MTERRANRFPNSGTSRLHLHNFMETERREKAHIPLKRRTLARYLTPGYGIALSSVAKRVPARLYGEAIEASEFARAGVAQKGVL